MLFSLVALRYSTPEESEKRTKLNGQIVKSQLSSAPGVYQINDDVWLFDMTKALHAYSKLVATCGNADFPVVSCEIDSARVLQVVVDAKLAKFLSAKD